MHAMKCLSGICVPLIVLCALAGLSHSGEKDFLPGFAQYLEEYPFLTEGGGTIVADGDNWLALGVGVAARTRKEQSKYSLWKIADIHAVKNVAEALEGSLLSGMDSADTVNSSVMRQEIDGIVSGSREVGRWKSNDGKVYHVMRAVFSPGHPMTKARSRFPAQNIEINAPWREEFLSRAFLRNGGVDIATINGNVYLLVVGTAPLKNKSASAQINASRVADVKARANLLAFYDGVRLQASTEVSTMQFQEHVEEILRSRTSAQIKGIAGRMKNVGGWVSEAGDVVARAYIVNADDL